MALVSGLMIFVQPWMIFIKAWMVTIQSLTIWGTGCSNLAGGALSDGFDVGQTIKGGVVTLGAPDGFAEGFEDVMQGRMAVAVACLALLEGLADARGLVDGELLFDGQMQGQVQEGIDLAVFGAEIPLHAVGGFEQGVVFRMVGDQVGADHFHLGEDFTALVLAPGVHKELPGLLSGGVEHGWSYSVLSR